MSKIQHQVSPAELKTLRSLVARENGKLGGPARAKALSPERRQEIARQAGIKGAAERARRYQTGQLEYKHPKANAK